MYGGEEYRRPVVLQPPEAGDSWGGSVSTDYDIDGSTTRSRFREFFRNFRIDNVFIYRDSLIRHWNRRELFVEVDLSHLNQYDPVLFNSLQVEQAAETTPHTSFLTRHILSLKHRISQQR
jgi:DNA replicative helicase MCM subunit Mcm2 (Cdc46/Mcm family)